MKRVLTLILTITIVLTTILTSCNITITTDVDSSIITQTEETIETTVETTEETTEDETTEETTEEVVEYKKAAINFNSIVYRHIEESEFDEYDTKIRQLMAEQVDFDTLIEAYDEVDAFFEDVYTMNKLAEINYYKDTTSEEYKEESDYISELFNNIRQKYIYLWYDGIVDPYYEQEMLEHYGEKDIEYIKNLKETFSDEFIQISTKIDKLVNEYTAIEDDIKIKHRSKEYSIDELIELYYKGSVSYLSLVGYLKKYYQTFGDRASEIYIELVGLYKQQAKLLGYDNAIEYFYEYVFERDYGEAEAKKLSEYTKKYIIPLAAELDAKINISDSETTKWQNITDAPDIYIDYLEEYFKEISPDMEEAYNYMNKYELIYREHSNTKASIAFTVYISTYDIPYIFLGYDGGLNELYTYIHEFGHFYSYYISEYTDSNNLDIAEIASQANEILFAQKYIKPITGKLSFVAQKLSDKLSSIIDGSIMDEFQRRAFEEETLTKEKLASIFESLVKEYNYYLPSYIEPADYWTLISHNFQSPFYYISYATSLFPVIELFEMAETDREKAINTYNKLAKLDEEIDFLVLLDNCGLSSPFEEETYQSIKETLMNFAKKL